jgi:hypothetical protein
MGVLCELDLLGLLHPDGSTRHYAISFETILRGRTNFDAVLREDDRVVLTIEAKYTEKGFGPCRYPEKDKCDGTWWKRQEV